MRRPFFAVAATALCASLALPAHANDIERMFQGGFGGFKYGAKESLNIKYGDDFTQTAYFFDHNPQMPDGTAMCIGAQFVPRGNRQHFKRWRTDGALLTSEASYELGRISGRYNLTDPNTIIPGFDLFVPNFDRDVYLWNKWAVWDKTRDGIPFSTIYQTTAGANVLFLNNFEYRGRERPGDLNLGYCGTYLGDHEAWENRARSRPRRK
jgi:hypothetical protein